MTRVIVLRHISASLLQSEEVLVHDEDAGAFLTVLKWKHMKWLAQPRVQETFLKPLLGDLASASDWRGYRPKCQSRSVGGIGRGIRGMNPGTRNPEP